MMTQYLVTIFRPVGYDHSVLVDEAMREAISQLNRDMVAAGVRVYVGGLQSANHSCAIVRHAEGELQLHAGLYLQARHYADSFWVLELDTMQQALEWGKRAALACRGDVEVRPFWPTPVQPGSDGQT